MPDFLWYPPPSWLMSAYLQLYFQRIYFYWSNNFHHKLNNLALCIFVYFCIKKKSPVFLKFNCFMSVLGVFSVG